MSKRFARVWVRVKSPTQAKGYRLVPGRRKTKKRILPTMRFSTHLKWMPRRARSIQA